jgi:hypothetical protein
VVKTGRGRLTLVTALTVASLLLATSAVSALANGHGDSNGNGRGGGQGNVEHTQQVSTMNAPQSPSVGHGDDVQNNGDVNRQQGTGDQEDLVNAPAQVTGETRPGLGCGDRNHVHTGPPGNPGKTCQNEDGSSGD